MMVVFVLICVALVALAVAALVWPLLRPRAAVAAGHTAAVLGILKEEREALERDRLAGLLDEAAYTQALSELQARVLEEVPNEAQPRRTHAGERALVLTLALLLPVAASALYLLLGNRDAFDPQIAHAQSAQQLAQQLRAGQTAAVIEQARAQLERQADNSELWFVLAQAHIARQEFAAAAAAYEKLNALEPNDVGLLTDWADALAQTQGGRLQGRPEALLEQALGIEPGNGKALAMSGAAAYERGDYARAVAQWEKLRPLVAGTELAPQIEQSIAQARRAGALPNRPNTPNASNAPAAATASIAGRVQVHPELATKLAPTDTVFVVARAVEANGAGSRMPIAVLRLQAKDLPSAFTLDDTLTLNAERTLSAFTQVVVSARVSKSGQAMAQAGDLESAAQTVRLGAKNVQLVIDRTRP